tara:strand:+ start:6035 stop:6979 length:945 start_codon:yes stop_codon:yes gene_type:complete
MAINASDIKITPNFKLTVSGNSISVTDTTDYNALGFSPIGTVKGLLQITNPTGALEYQNAGWPATYSSPDTTGAAPESSLKPLTPTASGEVIKGVYSILYNVEVLGSGVGADGEYETSHAASLVLDEVCGDVEMSFSCDCPNPFVMAVDRTNYGSYVVPGGNTYDAKLFYPSVLGKGSVASASSSVETIDLYTGSWESSFVVTANYILPDGTNVAKDYVFGNSINVECNSGDCDIYACLKEIEKEYSYNLCKNLSLAERYRLTLVNAQTYYGLYKLASGCGDTVSANYYRSKIIAECPTCAENCDETPTKIVCE